MDTKWKNSKKISFLVAGVIILIATVAFMAMYPFFKKQAAKYDEDLLQSEDFLEEFYQANFVLYKDLQDMVRGEDVSFADLFLTVEESECHNANIDYVELEEANFTELARKKINTILELWQLRMRQELMKEVHYYMVDHATGKVVTNTKGQLALLGTDDASEALGEYYPYYVKMTYDDAGNLEETAVKCVNAENLLMNVQNIMKSYILRNQFWAEVEYYGYFGEDDAVYYINDDSYYKATSQITNGPKSVTVCYAISRSQMEALHTAYRGIDGNLNEDYKWNQWYAYYRSGAVEAFQITLAVIGVIALLLCFWKHYHLHQLKGVKLHLEFSLAAIIFWFIFSTELVVYLLNFTQRGYFALFYEEFFYWIPGNNMDGILERVFQVVVLFFLLGIWYYLVTTLGEVFSLGIKGFLQERSLVLKSCIKVKEFAGKNVEKFKEEILHIDLGEKTNKIILKLVIVNFVILAVCCVMWMFGWAALLIYSVVLYFGLKKYVQRIQQQYGKVLTATESIAEGNLDTELDDDWGVFESYKEELATIQTGFKKAVAEEVKSQKMKTELITNVSHDLKTPLTAITTYIELLEDEAITSEQRKNYLEVLKKKSARLKFLIEDLFEVSKANSGNVAMNLVDVDICNLMRQVYLEYEDKVEETELLFRFYLPEEKVVLKLDSQKTCRVFENLYTNIIKYAMPRTRVYVHGEKTEKGIRIELKNMSASELNIPPEELTERFVRGDSSRNTEGSGLGLAIARSFVELQNGKFVVEIDGDLFKVVIEW